MEVLVDLQVLIQVEVPVILVQVVQVVPVILVREVQETLVQEALVGPVIRLVVPEGRLV